LLSAMAGVFILVNLSTEQNGATIKMKLLKSRREALL